MCRAIETVCGAPVQIKWTNDLVLRGKKLCGILAETVLVGDSVSLIIGAGVNVSHRREDFGPQVCDIATSLALEGYAVSRNELAAAMIAELYRLAEELGGNIGDWVADYRRRCLNLGRKVQLLWSENRELATVIDIDDRFGLVVRRTDGTLTTVRTGEVSVRGLYGYVE